MDQVCSPLAAQTTELDDVRCEIVASGPFGQAAWHVATVIDQETGVVLGRRLLPAELDGSPPSKTSAEFLALVGGPYRLASVRVDCALVRLADMVDRIARTLRRPRARSRAAA